MPILSCAAPAAESSAAAARLAANTSRWFRERACVHCLARDAGISQDTGYRYLHEGISVLAEQAPDLHDVLDRCRREGMTHITLDGTLIASDRLARRTRSQRNLEVIFAEKTSLTGLRSTGSSPAGRPP